MISIACVVEGHGEVEALPVLLRRIAGEHGTAIQVRKPHRVPRSKPWDEWARAIALQQSALGEDDGAVVVLLDSDDDDLEVIEAEIRSATVARSGRDDSIVCIAVREYEAWFLAAIDSLTTHALVKDDASYSADPEDIRNAKGALDALMTTSYSEILHQPKFSAVMNLDTARERSVSFRRFCDQLTLVFST